VRGGGVEAGHFSVGEESVRPPDATEHLVADAQLVLAWRREVKPRIQPVLTKVEVEGEILRSATQKKGMCIGGDSMQLLGTTISVISSSPATCMPFVLSPFQAFCGNLMVQLFQGKFMRVFNSICSLVLLRWLYTKHYCFRVYSALFVLSPFRHIKCSKNKFLTCCITTRFGSRFLGQHFTYDVAPTLD